MCCTYPSLGALNSYAIYEDQQWWRLFTYAFLHGSFHHLFGNILSLLIVSFFMMPEVKPMGQAAVFLASSLFSGLAFLALLAGHCRRSQRRHLRHGGHLYNSVPVHLDKSGTTTRRACCHWSYLHNKSLLSFARTTSMTGHISGLACGHHDCHRHHHL